MLPGEVAWVLNLLGYDWPEADESKIMEAAGAWRTFAEEVAQLEARGVTTAGQVISSNSGDAADSFAEAWRQFSDGGDGYLSDARQTAEFIAVALDGVAVEVMIVKAMVIAQLIALAFEFAAAQAAAPFTFGLSEGGLLAATQAARIAVRELLMRLRRVIAEKVTQIAEKASVQAIKDLVRNFTRDQAKALAKRGATEVGRHVLKPMLQDAVKDGAKAVAQDTVRQGIDMHYGQQKGYDVGAAGSAGLTEGAKQFTETGNYVEKATEPLTEKVTERVSGRSHEATGTGEDATGGDGTGDGGNTGRTQRAVRAVFG
ncbi:PE-PGRS family protein [Streptomyces sp. NBC_01537]|uniref:WXG100-like domain-containing protein n=1 Tax=Streptomyces sp. NBC_01537 TaxID=2903896 RepID=UPI0038640E41